MTQLAPSAALLDEDNLFAEKMPGFEYRPGQVAMAAKVDTLIRQPGIEVIEAGSGSGKTLAYLVPLLSQQRRAVISTATHVLQEQLFDQDIPLVKSVLGSNQTVVLLKGRSNYLCPYFSEKRLRQAGHIPLALHPIVEQVIQHCRQTNDGDLSHLQFPQELQPHLTCSSEDCLGDVCPDVDRCPLMQARKKASFADVVICNHNSLLAGQLEKIQSSEDEDYGQPILVIDEAHRLMDVSHSAGAVKLSSRQLQIFFRESLKVIQQETPEQVQVIAYLKRAESVVSSLYQKTPSLTDYKRVEHTAIIEQFLQGLIELQRWFDAFIDRSMALKQLARRCSNLVKKLERLLVQEGLCCVQSRGRGFVLQLIPVSALEAMRRFLDRQQDSSVLLTSATLSVGGHVAPFLDRLGLGHECYLKIEEHHDFQKRARLYLPPIDVEPSDVAFSQCFSEVLEAFLSRVTGRVLVLFSSHTALEVCGKQLQLSPQRALLIQGQKPSKHLVKQFRDSENAVLLGTGSYWEGMDLSGASLSAVVIDKLPFASPNQPMVNIRSHHLQRHGVDAFNEYLLPEAAMRLRQGCGRLLRRIGEKGVIMLADSRIQQRDYGAFFLATLPEMPIIQSLDEVSTFLEN